MNIRAVIFDIYGTLLEIGPPPPAAEARWQALCRDHLHIEPRHSRLELADATQIVIARHHAAARARGIAWPEVQWPAVIAEILPELNQLPPPDREEFLFQHMRTGRGAHMNAAAADILRGLRARGLALGIASNAQAYTLREMREALAGHELDEDAFDARLCFWSYEHGFSKPDPHVFEVLTARLAAWGIAAEQVLMIGDHPDNDIEPARAHGWQAWHLSENPSTKPGGDWLALRRWLEPEPS